MSRPSYGRANGVRATTFTAADTTFDVGGTAVRGKAYQGTFIGPTLHVRPGERIKIRLVNRLGEPTNLHEHGFHALPTGISDNVLRMMPWALQCRRGRDPVRHGSGHVLAPLPSPRARRTAGVLGLAGVIVVDGLVGRLPEPLRTIPDRVMALKDLQVQNGAIPTQNIDSNAPTTRTINGLSIRTWRCERTRPGSCALANISADIWYRLRPTARGSTSSPRTRTQPAASGPPTSSSCHRASATTCSCGGARRAVTGSARCATAPVPTATRIRSASCRRSIGAARRSRASPFPPRWDRCPTTLVKRRRLTVNDDNATGRFFINGRQFNPRRVNEYVKLNTNEEWALRNTSRELHPFTSTPTTSRSCPSTAGGNPFTACRTRFRSPSAGRWWSACGSVTSSDATCSTATSWPTRTTA